MKYCRQCGAALPDDTKYCSECGAPVSGTAVRNVEAEALPRFDYPVQNTRRRRKKKSVFQRFWFWLLVIIIAGSQSPKQGDVLIQQYAAEEPNQGQQPEEGDNPDPNLAPKRTSLYK